MNNLWRESYKQQFESVIKITIIPNLIWESEDKSASNFKITEIYSKNLTIHAFRLLLVVGQSQKFKNITKIKANINNDY